MKKIAVICVSQFDFEHDFLPMARKKIRNKKIVFVCVLSKITLQIHEFSGVFYHTSKKTIKENILQEIKRLKLQEYEL